MCVVSVAASVLARYIDFQGCYVSLQEAEDEGASVSYQFTDFIQALKQMRTTNLIRIAYLQWIKCIIAFEWETESKSFTGNLMTFLYVCYIFTRLPRKETSLPWNSSGVSF